MGTGAKIKAVIKVGVSSNIKFNNMQAFRAITYDDMSSLLASNDNISLIIVENASREDMVNIEDVLSTTNLNLYLLNPSFEAKTNGYGLVQEEIESDHVYLFKEITDLQRAITNFYGIDVRTFVEEKAEEVEESVNTEESNGSDGANETDETDGTTETEETDGVDEGIESENDGFDDTLFTEDETEEEDDTKLSIEEPEQGSQVSETELEEFKTDNYVDSESETEKEVEIEDKEKLENKDGSGSLDIIEDVQETESEDIYKPENASLQEALSSSLDVGDKEVKRDRDTVKVIEGSKGNTESDTEYLWNAASLDKSSEASESLTESENENVIKLQTEVETLNVQLKSEQERIDYCEETISKLRAIKISLEDKLAFSNDLINRLQTTQDIVDISIQDTEETLGKLDELKIERSQLQSKITELTSELEKISTLEAKLSSKENDYRELQDELDRAKQDNRSKEIEEQLKYETDIRLKISELLEDMAFKYSLMVDRFKELEGTNSIVEAEAKKEQKQRKELEVQVLDLKDQLQKSFNIRAERERQLNLKIEEFSRINSQNTDLAQKYERAKQKLSLDCEELKSQIEVLNTREDGYKSMISGLESQLTVQENIAEDATAKLRRFEDLDIDELQSTLKSTDIGNTRLVGDIGRLKIEISGLKGQLASKGDLIGRLEKEKTAIEMTAKALSNTVSTGERLKISCNYTGRAQIIPVFGGGSYGITTTVMSLAKNLKGNILLLDFDCVSPKLDQWVGKNAMIPELTGLPQLMNSSFGALIEKGTDFIIDNQQLVVQNTKLGSNKLKKSNRRVDYFSGVYTQIDLYKFAAVDFTSLLNFFGNEYDYILVDLGRIGGNESTTALIKMFDSISWRNVIICQNDKYDVRAVYTKTKMNKLHLAKSLWVLNMSTSTALDEFTKKALTNASLIVLTKKADMYGELSTFDLFSSYHKEKLGQLADMIEGI